VIGWMLAAQLVVVAHGPDTASTCAPFEITAAASAPGIVAPRLVLPLGPSLQLLRTTLHSRLERDGAGRPTSITEATFDVAVAATGRVTLPAVVGVLAAQRVATAPLVIHLASVDPVPPLVLVRASLDDGRHRGTDDSLFVGQQVDYVVDVQLNEAARQRLRRNPTFFPPEMPAVLAYDLAPPPAVARVGQHCFETLSYHRALFPLFPGSTSIPPATLTYALPVSTSFFSREESYELRTDSVHLVVAEPPSEGRPTDFTGAVGVVTATMRLGAARPRVGDPLVLTVRLAGTGNVKLLPRPVITIGWASIALGDERVELDTSRARVAGAKEFDWLLTPRRDGHQAIPPLRYPYFDPERAAYQVAVADSIGLDVASGSLAAADTTVTDRLAVRATMREERAPPLPSHPWFWLALVAAPVPAGLRRVMTRRRRRTSGLTAARRLRQLAGSRTSVPARELRRLYLDTLHERIPSLVAATPRVPLGRQLRRAGVTDTTADAAQSLLDRLDAAAFSSRGSIDPSLGGEAAVIARAIDEEAVRTRAITGPMRAVALLALVSSVAALSAMPETAVHRFAEGVRAYDGGQFLLAERLFARAADDAPRAVDAWFNLGTAALAANDTGRAALGWQRALRLDPLDVESRDRLATIAPAPITAPGYVPPVPVDALAAAALALWLAAWLGLALPASRRPNWLRSVGGGAIVVAVVSLAGALELRTRLDPRGLALLRGTTVLKEAPVLGSASVAAGVVGEVGTIGARDGAWVRITFDAGRVGWLSAAALIPLDEPGPLH
jgi:hypothetical protein